MKGIGVSPGIAIGRAYWLHQQKPQVSGLLLVDTAEVEREMAAYREGVRTAMEDLGMLIGKIGKKEAEILEVQVELLQDPAWEEVVIQHIGENRLPARDAVLLAMGRFIQMFEQIEDDYMQARAADIKDMGHRLFRKLAGEASGSRPDLPEGDLSNLPEGQVWIVLAEDLSPSDTLALDISRVAGIVTQAGGKNSHAAIVARLRSLPAVAGVGEALAAVSPGDELVLDGGSGAVLVNPPATLVGEYRQRQEDVFRRREALQLLKDIPAVTTDGVRVHLLANIASAEEMDAALAFGAEGVGLLRTELLFMGRDHLPDEEEQLAFYKRVLLRRPGRPVTIRTLDIGGDKPLPYLNLPKEENPFLGYRAIRICLDRTDIFLTQLRAILRAGLFGDCRMMFPMVSSVEELRQAKELVSVAKEQLRTEGIAFAAGIPVGVMIEIPSAALTADQLAREADFFSIGTNDLCQYTLAVDRMNEKIAALYDPFHPAVLCLIQMVIDEGRRAGIPVGMCGEMAGDTNATELLFNMGLREFSMNAPSIPEVKEIIIQL